MSLCEVTESMDVSYTRQREYLSFSHIRDFLLLRGTSHDLGEIKKSTPL